MCRGMWSLNCAILFLFIFIFSAFATESRLIKLPELKSCELRKLATLWDNILGAYDDSGYNVIQIEKKEENKSKEDTLKDILDEKYIDDVTVKEFEMNDIEELAKRQVNFCIWFSSFAKEKEIKEKESQLKRGLAKALSTKEKFNLYSGKIFGAFDMEYNYISLADWKNNQVLTIFCGYSE